MHPISLVKMPLTAAGMALVLASALCSVASARGATLTFEQAVDMAATSSHQRQIAEDESQAQTARRRQAAATFGPTFSVGGVAGNFDKKLRQPFGDTIFSIRDDKTRTGYAQVVQPLTPMILSWQRTGAEKRGEEIAALAVEMAKVDAGFAAAQAYRHAQEAQEIQRIAQASITATESQARDAAALLTSGRLIKSEVLKIEIAKQEAKANLARAEGNYGKALANLAYLINLDDPASITLEPLPSASEMTKARSANDRLMLTQNGDVHATYQHALAARIDVKQADLMVEKAAYGERIAAIKYLPKVEALIRWEREYSTPPFGVPRFNRMYALEANWDLWDNGSRTFARHEAVANSHKAQAQVQDTKDRLRLQLQTVQADLKAAEKSLAAAQATVQQAEEAYRMDKARFSSGLVTATDLVLSETQQTRARGDLVTALTELDLLNMMLQKTIGETRPRATLR